VSILTCKLTDELILFKGCWLSFVIVVVVVVLLLLVVVVVSIYLDGGMISVDV